MLASDMSELCVADFLVKLRFKGFAVKLYFLRTIYQLLADYIVDMSGQIRTNRANLLPSRSIISFHMDAGRTHISLSP